MAARYRQLPTCGGGGRRPRWQDPHARPAPGRRQATSPGTGPQPESTRHAGRASAGPGRGPRHAPSASQSRTAPFVRRPKRHESAHWVSRTALCVEVRDPRRASGPKAEAVGEQVRCPVCLHAAAGAAGRLPRPAGRHRGHRTGPGRPDLVLEGLSAAARPAPEAAAGHARPGRHRGQHPPGDSNWRELVHNTEFLYQAAFESRLSAEKFMTDGRHTGTGGGNHFVMGGATPADSPFLRKARTAGQPAAVLAQPSQPQLPVQRHVRRPHQPGAARRRGPQRPALRAGDRAAGDPPQPRGRTARPCRPGWSTARCATS
jgi:hypothetical protein